MNSTETRTKVMDRKDVDIAIAAAEKFLDDNAGVAWIKNSSLSLRAYRLGAFGALQGIAQEDHLRGLLMRAFADTMFPREADDTFGSTKSGKAYKALASELTQRNPNSSDAEKALARLRREIDGLDVLWQKSRGYAKELLKQVEDSVAKTKNATATKSSSLSEEDNPNRYELQYALLGSLEDCVRRIALLETDHRLPRRREG